MAMKQTQTKLFDFADVGLDFCSGSKNLFPDRFKKMLSQGYNEQTVASVSVTGNQVTLNYGVAHGYAADRVLKINSGPLAAINGGEFWIDAVTTTSLTLTIDAAPVSIAGGFVTKIASLGWGLVYEQAHIQIYKFKHIDDTDMYARFCFQNATTSGNRNCVAVGIGRIVDLTLGQIIDAAFDLGTCVTVAETTTQLKWDFTNSTSRTYDNYSYSQGLSIFGKAMIVGSIYHLFAMFAIGSAYGTHIAGILPTVAIDYSELQFPLLICTNNGASTTSASFQGNNIRFYIGTYRCKDLDSTSGVSTIGNSEKASNSYVPFDSFNTAIARPINLYLYNENIPIGFVAGGAYMLYLDATNHPATGFQNLPLQTVDIDHNHLTLVHASNITTLNTEIWFAVPVEEIKLAY